MRSTRLIAGWSIAAAAAAAAVVVGATTAAATASTAALPLLPDVAGALLARVKSLFFSGKAGPLLMNGWCLSATSC